MAPAPHVGVFDSGVGGLSVLNAIRERLPKISLSYIGDVAHAPYGHRGASDVMDRSRRIVGHLAATGTRLIVVACNTVTVLGIEQLRGEWPELIFVGVEPGVKPAVALSDTGRVAVLTTPATAASARLRALIDEFASDAHVLVVPCPGLAGAIERGVIDGPELHEILEPICREVSAKGVDVAVLGCTHYPFVSEALAKLLGPGVTLIDTGTAIARRVASLLGPASPGSNDDLRIFSTGDVGTMSKLASICKSLGTYRMEHLALE